MSDEFPLQPPEPDYVSEEYVMSVPYEPDKFSDRWKLRLLAEELLEKQIGDQVQLTSLRVKKPNLASRVVAKILRRQPQARLYATVKF